MALTFESVTRFSNSLLIFQISFAFFTSVLWLAHRWALETLPDLWTSCSIGKGHIFSAACLIQTLHLSKTRRASRELTLAVCQLTHFTRFQGRNKTHHLYRRKQERYWFWVNISTEIYDADGKLKPL